jgi:hypothetical protein
VTSDSKDALHGAILSDTDRSAWVIATDADVEWVADG